MLTLLHSMSEPGSRPVPGQVSNPHASAPCNGVRCSLHAGVEENGQLAPLPRMRQQPAVRVPYPHEVRCQRLIPGVWHAPAWMAIITG